MAVQRHLQKSPITEALVDIQVKLPQEVDVTRLKTIHAFIDKEYPQVKERVKGEFKVKLVEKSVETTPVSVDGFQYISSDGKQIV